MGRTIVEIVSDAGERTAIITSDIICVQMQIVTPCLGTGRGSGMMPYARTMVKLRGMEQEISVTGDYYDAIVSAMKKEE